MKQQLNGRKIQNWHRPPGPRQLSRWFRRHQYDPAPDASDFDDSIYDDWCSEEGGEGHDLRCHELKQLLREIVHRPVPLFRLEWAIDAALRSGDEFAGGCGPSRSAADLEQQLAEFVQGILHFPTHPTTQRRIRDAIDDDIYLDVMMSAGKHGNGHNLIQNLCLFAPFWIRSPRTWKGGKVSLVDHLLVRYDVPRFLYPEWSGEPGFPRLKWLCWFILFAQGGSLRRAAGRFCWNIPSRFEYHLRMAAAGASPTEACVFAQVMRWGGSPLDCRRILSNPAFVVDTTEVSGRDWQSDFWEATVRWVVAHSAAITDEQCEMILSWAMHEYTEAERGSGKPFSWKHRGLRTVLERSFDYQRQLQSPWACYRWRPHGWDWKPTGPALDDWCFVELTSGAALFREGQALRHCVATYATRCASGHSAIVSVRFQDARRITVEIDPATGHVVQAKGMCNRFPSSEEQRVIRLWVNAVIRPSLSSTKTV